MVKVKALKYVKVGSFIYKTDEEFVVDKDTAKVFEMYGLVKIIDKIEKTEEVEDKIEEKVNPNTKKSKKK